MRPHDEGGGQLAVTQDLDRLPERTHHPALSQRLWRYLRTGGELCQPLQVYCRIGHSKRVAESPAAGQTSNERRLAALEAGPGASAAARLLPLEPATRVRAVAAGVTSSDALARPPGARGRSQLVLLHG